MAKEKQTTKKSKTRQKKAREKYPKSPMPAQKHRVRASSGNDAAPAIPCDRLIKARKNWREIGIITGGDSGIGRSGAVCLRVKAGMWQSIISSKKRATPKKRRGKLEAEGGRSLLLPGDVSDAKFCQKAVEKTVEKFGNYYILVNNAAFQKHRIQSKK